MKYLFVIPTLYMGGAERQVSVLANSLANLGQGVCILKYIASEEEFPVNEKVKVISFLYNRSEYHKASRLKRVLFIRQVIKEENPDFVIPFLYEVALAVELATIGMNVNVFHWILNNPRVSPPKKRERCIMDWMVRRSKCTFVQNETQKNYYNAKLHSKIHVLFNPIDDSFFKIQHVLHPGDFVFCAAGRLHDQKNFGLLIRSFIRAFGKAEEVKLVIYGEGYLRAELQQLIDSEGYTSKILLPGRTNNMADAYARADAFVLSSDFEGMPNALMEAMASGVPSISTNCPTGPADLIDDHINGILVPVGDEKAMAAAMRNVYEDKRLKEMLSIMGRKKIMEICSAKEIARQMIAITKTITKTKI